MSYEQLIYVNSRDERIVFGVGSVYHVNVQKDVEGLSNLNNVIYSTNLMGQHGDTYVGERIDAKPIEIEGKIRSSDKETYLKLRREAVKVLNPELNGTLYYVYGDYVRKIWAKVENAPRFSHPKRFEEFSIRFKCLDPFWKEEKEHREDVATWIGDWEWPLEIDDEEGFEFEHHEESLIVDVYNDGHVSTGMRIVFKALGALTNPQLFNINTREFVKINRAMSAGDVITVDTSYGNKSVKLLSDGVESNIYRSMDGDSTFMQLDIGDNVFRYDADEGLANLEVTVYFSQKYLSI